MNRIALIVVGVMGAALWLSSRQPGTQAAATTTSVCGALNSDATWTALNRPHEVCAG